MFGIKKLKKEIIDTRRQLEFHIGKQNERISELQQDISLIFEKLKLIKINIRNSRNVGLDSLISDYDTDCILIEKNKIK
jgi:ribosomal protein S3